MERFDEFSEKASEIMGWFERALSWIEKTYDVNYKDPRHDLARRFLNEIMEFKPLEEEKRSSLKPWEKVPENPI